MGAIRHLEQVGRYNARVLEFASPIWLSVAAAVGALGAWALWRGQRRRRAVSSVRLWRGLDAEGGAKRRVLDPLWVLVVAAGMLAGLALGQPRWVSGTMPRPLDVAWAVRSTPGPDGVMEAWVRCAGTSDAVRLTINGVDRRVSAAELRQGIAVPVKADAEGRIRLVVRSGDAQAVASFVNRGGARPFGLLELTAAGAGVDPALRRVFGVQPNIRAGDPTVRPRVLLVNDPEVRPEDLENADLVIAQPATPLPGIVPGATKEGEWTPRVKEGSGFAWPKFVSLKKVHLREMREAAMGGDWRVVATADGMPWIAVREVARSGGGTALWLWLASSPWTDTDWVKDPGFVLFFAEMQRRAFGGDGATFVDWTRLAEAEVAGAAGVVELSPYVGVAGIGLLVGAMVWFVRRAR